MHPDVEDHQPARQAFVGNPHKVKRVSLTSPNVAKSDGDAHGTWTMIYDEGFEVHSSGQSFFAFSNFTFDANKHNTSHCEETMVGWYRNTARTEFGCYYGVKSGHIAKPAAPAPKAAKTVAPAVDNHKMNRTALAKKVAKINAKLSMLELGWTARSSSKWVGKTMSEINSYAGIARTRHLQKDMMSQRVMKRPSFLQTKGHSVKLPESFDR